MRFFSLFFLQSLDFFSFLFTVRTQSTREGEYKTTTTTTNTAKTAPPSSSIDVSMFGRVLKDQVKSKPTVVPDYTLDYGYEGGNSSGEEELTTEGISSPLHAENSSGFNDGFEPFGETFDALNQLEEDYSEDENLP